MKVLFLIVCLLSTLQGVALESVVDESRQPLISTASAEEITAFDTSLPLPPSIVPQDMQIPASIFEPRPFKSPLLAVGLACLMPGLGHVYLGDLTTAGTLMGAAGLGIGGTSFRPSGAIGFRTIECTWYYGIFAAYRDIRIYNGQTGYSYKMPMDTFSDLATAPFNIRILKKPEVWGGLLGQLVLAFSIGYLAMSEEHVNDNSAGSLENGLQPFTAFPIGLGEESLFRGFLQSQLSEIFTPWGGIALSSLIFGALHISNGQGLSPADRKGFYAFAIPLITLSGAYDGWLTYKNNSLQESVALHSWYDFTLFALGLLGEQAVSKKCSQFALDISF